MRWSQLRLLDSAGHHEADDDRHNLPGRPALVRGVPPNSLPSHHHGSELQRSTADVRDVAQDRPDRYHDDGGGQSQRGASGLLTAYDHHRHGCVAPRASNKARSYRLGGNQ